MAVVRISRTFDEDDRLTIQVQDDEAHPDGLMAETALVAVDTFIRAHHAVMIDCQRDFAEDEGEVDGL
jgi:hypothetical protein